MNQSLDFELKPEKRTVTPWSVFYLVTVLGVVLAGFQSSFAEPVPGGGNPSVVSVENKAVAVNSALPGREESTNSMESGERNAKGSSLTIPGIQSAILTVSKEIRTTAPIANLSTRPASAKPTQSANKPASDKSTLKSSASAASSVSKEKEGYYLELPSPRTSPETAMDGSNPMALGEGGGPQPAASVPISPVPAGWLNADAQQASSSQADALKLDPESQPLDLSSAPALSGAATNALVRVTLGLLAVLGLLLGFSRAVLPRLMARYPAFFENLKRKDAKTQNPFSASALSELSEPATEFPPDLYAELGGTVILSEESLPQVAETVQSSGAKARPNTQESTQSGSWLLALGRQKKEAALPALEDDPPFNLRFTSSLGKDKELHLVEIWGRQMVLASTPYNITLISDVSDSVQLQPATDLADSGDLVGEAGSDSGLIRPNQAETPETETVSDSVNASDDRTLPLLMGVELPPALASENENESFDPPFSEPEFEFLLDPQSDPVADEVADDAPVFMSPKSNLYATRPQRLLPLTEADRLYQRYLEIVTPNAELEAEETVLPSPSLQSVVILNEYDDTYGY